jgi:hypothetical protein
VPVTIPIIDQLVHPALGLLSRVALPANPYNTFLAVAPPQNPLVALTYGILLNVSFVPPAWGLRLGAPDEYDPPLAQITSHYLDLTGFDLIQQVEHMGWTNYAYLWVEPLPALVTIYMQPGVQLDAYWLQT